MLWALILLFSGVFIGFVILALLSLASEKEEFKDHLHTSGADEGDASEVVPHSLDNIICLGSRAKRHKASISRTSKRRGRILFVDDEEDLLDLVGRMLRHLGYEAVTYNSSLEALSFLKSEKQNLDLIIVDQVMPELSGTELAKEAKRLHKEAPVILFTGFSDMISPEKINEIGIQEVVEKPVTLDNLAKIVNRLLNYVDAKPKSIY
jgi:CheY-like chemotaxis protein